MKRSGFKPGTDHWRAEESRGGSEDGRPGSSVWGIGSDDLQLEVEVWRLEVSEARRLRELESENAKLKRLPADAMPDQAALKDILAKSLTPVAKQEAVVHLQAYHGMSERRACRVVDADRKSVRCRSTRADGAGL